MAPYAPDKIKNSHFECGLPAGSSNPKKANFGFFMFAIMFIIADMSGLFFSLFVYANDTHAQTIAALFALIIALVITIAMREFNYAEIS
jgi:NADH-quinone oxidoreductase subunit A